MTPLTSKERRELEAVRHLKAFLKNGELPKNEALGESLIPLIKAMTKKTKLEEEELWKVTRKHKRRVEVLDSTEAIRKALLLCHEGLGHRQLGSAYEYLF